MDDMSTKNIATFPRSRLREPVVVESAQRGRVLINLGANEDPLVIMSSRELERSDELVELMTLFITTVVALDTPSASPVLFGDNAFLAGWDEADRTRFRAQFAEALAESIRRRDPAIARFYLDACRRAGESPRSSSPQFTGELTDDARRQLAKRVPSR